MEENKRICSFNYASLNFTDAQYNEALKKASPDNANQILDALIDASGQRDDTCSNIKANQADERASLYSESTSSCYSSITSLPASSDQSLESSQQPVALKKIYIDGSNVARTHGKNVSFSWTGIRLCVDWFHNRHHHVKVFVPEDKCNHLDDRTVLDYLMNIDALVETPKGCNDDFFILIAARHNNGVIVSNDLYRDEVRSMKSIERTSFENFVNSNRLRYVFVDDLFIPANDPQGRFGVTLDQFLRETSETSDYHKKLSRTKSHQRNQRQTNLQRMNSVPIEQSCGPTMTSNNQYSREAEVPQMIGKKQPLFKTKSYNN